MTEQEFYQKIPEWIGSDKSTWNHVTLFAYFCFKYEQKTSVRFKMVRSKKGPTSTKETKDMSKLINVFCPDTESDKDGYVDSSNECRKKAILKVYNYINWMFDYKFRNSPAVSGTQIFLVPSILNEFERMYALHLKKKESSSNIDIFLKWIKDNHEQALDLFQLETKEDISLFKKYVENSTTEDQVSKIIYKKAVELGF